MGKIKLLWVGDSPAVSTGFGRVSQATLENLYNTDKYDIAVLGVNHLVGDPHRYEGMFKIYPARTGGNVYGFNRVEEIIEKEKPDVIIINNDLWIVSEYVKFIPEGNKVFTYSPVDALPVHKNWINILDSVNARIGTYTEFAKGGIIAANNNVSIDIIGHGVDTDEFYPIEDARKFLANIPEDAFVVQNVNRNQPRKRLDLFLKAMQLWLSTKSKNDNIVFYYHGCFLPDTKVVVSDGVKNIQDITVGTRVFDTDGKFRSVSHTFVRDYTGEVIRLSCQGANDIVLTPEHPVLAVKGVQCRNGKNITCSKVCKSRYKTLKSGVITSNCSKKYFLSYETSFVNASELTNHDFVAVPKSSVDEISPNIGVYDLCVDSNLARLFGLFVSEGSTSGCNINFSLNKKEEDLLDFIKDTMITYFGKEGKWYNTSKNAGNYVINSKELAQWFGDTFGRGSHHKKIPSFIMKGSLETIRDFVRGLYDGDGCYRGGIFNYSSVSETLVYQLKYVLMRLGIYSSLKPTCPDKDGFSGFTVDVMGSKCKELSFILQEYVERPSRTWSHVWEDDKYFYIPVLSVTKEQYTGKVYNFEVESSHTYNAEFLVVHNCLKDVGWNLIDLAQRWNIDDRFLVSDQDGFSPADGVSLSKLCKIYNTADVQVMTSVGEGFGLSPFESAACGVAQIVPNHSACKELWEGVAPLIDVKYWEVLTGGINTEGGVIDIDHLVSIIEDLYQNRGKLKELRKKCYEHVQQEKFTWGYVANQFDVVVTDMLKSGIKSKKYSDK